LSYYIIMMSLLVETKVICYNETLKFHFLMICVLVIVYISFLYFFGCSWWWFLFLVDPFLVWPDKLEHIA